MSTADARFWNQAPLAEHAFPTKYGPKFRCRSRRPTAAGPCLGARLPALPPPSTAAKPTPAMPWDLVPRPVPQRPVLGPGPGTWPEVRCPGTRSRDMARLGSAGLVELRVDRARRPLRDAGHALELLLARREETLRRSEVLEQRAPPGRAHTLERVEDRLLRLRVAPLSVEAEREAVRLVADPLQELEPRRVPVEDDRLRAIRDEHFLLPLRERDHGHARQVERLHRRQHGRQ